jgi:LacI family transcriptional regulator, gluconate utilization system Gnt-I transcriptional repressor
MEKQKRPPRLNDVAARARVSTATVSRFFNNPEMVAPATAERIREAVAATSYIPNLVAGGLASNRTKLVAVLVPEIAQSIFNDTIQAMIDELSDDGYTVMLGLTGYGDDRMLKLINAAIGRRSDAIILTGLLTNPDVRNRLRAQPVTVIETWGLPPDPIDIAVGFSHRAVGKVIAQYVHRHGFERPYLLTVEGTRAQMRHAGFIEAWREAGHGEPTEERIPVPMHFSQGRDAFRRSRILAQQPDVIVCGSDLLAQAVIIEAQAAGCRVPDDLAVIGFGNVELSAEMRPSITTVSIDGAGIGRMAVSVLRRRAAGEVLASHNFDVGFTLIPRESA